MKPQQSADHEFEAAPGLPEPLPKGERLLWQGAPDWRRVAVDLMHLRALAIYFGLMLAWRGAAALQDGATAGEAFAAVAGLLPLPVFALVILLAMARMIASTSVYTITDRRVVMRIGMVLSVTFNLPFKRIDSVDLRARADGSGDLCIRLAADDRIGYAHLWPHARPWRLRRTEPSLRALSDARAAAAVLADALSAHAQATGSQAPAAGVTAGARAAGAPARPGLAVAA